MLVIHTFGVFSFILIKNVDFVRIDRVVIVWVELLAYVRSDQLLLLFLCYKRNPLYLCGASFSLWQVWQILQTISMYCMLWETWSLLLSKMAFPLVIQSSINDSELIKLLLGILYVYNNTTQYVLRCILLNYFDFLVNACFQWIALGVGLFANNLSLRVVVWVHDSQSTHCVIQGVGSHVSRHVVVVSHLLSLVQCVCLMLH